MGQTRVGDSVHPDQRSAQVLGDGLSPPEYGWGPRMAGLAAIPWQSSSSCLWQKEACFQECSEASFPGSCSQGVLFSERKSVWYQGPSDPEMGVRNRARHPWRGVAGVGSSHPRKGFLHWCDKVSFTFSPTSVCLLQMYKCKHCGKVYCASCKRGEFAGTMRAANVCGNCKKVSLCFRLLACASSVFLLAPTPNRPTAYYCNISIAPQSRAYLADLPTKYCHLNVHRAWSRNGFGSVFWLATMLTS